jgi:aspartyl-tRNA(Asn)/glutamyl-tRNA(Gln) amidotransferase subunit A
VHSASLQDLRIAVPTTRVFDDIDAHVSRTFESALAVLVDAGAKVSQIPVPEFADVGQTAEIATFPAVEGYSWHRDLLGRARDRYDPRVAVRIERGRSVSAADYLWLLRRRSELMRAVRSRVGGFDVLAMPTVPIIAPPIGGLDRDDDLYHRVNLLVLRNPTLINFLDGCALSLPCHGDGEAPVGLMLARFDGADHELLAIGETAERVLAAKRAGNR